MPLLTINGENRSLTSDSIEGMLAELALPAPIMLVEHNGKALHRSEWVSVRLSDGDCLELMKVAAGG